MLSRIKKLEHFVTPEWPITAVLEKEVLSPKVLDPATGIGVLAEAALKKGYDVTANDIFNWGYPLDRKCNFLTSKKSEYQGKFSILMNPPFSLAELFVRKAFEIGAEKIVSFQRFNWIESNKRKPFWDELPPKRIHVCGDRATCLRYDLYKKAHLHKKKQSNTTYAWFVWEGLSTGEPSLFRIYKNR